MPSLADSPRSRDVMAEYHAKLAAMRPQLGRCPIALDVCRQAVEDLETAKSRETEAYRRSNEDDEAHKADGGERRPYPESHAWDAWTNAVSRRLYDAETHLCGCILLVNGRIDALNDVEELAEKLKPCWKPAALELDGKVYLAVPYDEDGDASGAKPRLVIVDSASFHRGEQPC